VGGGSDGREPWEPWEALQVSFHHLAMSPLAGGAHKAVPSGISYLVV